MKLQKTSQPDCLDIALSAIRKSYGTDAIFRLGENTTLDIPFLPTGNLAIDKIVSNGRGMPRGRVIEIIGPESSGKTSLCFAIVAAAQRAGGQAAFIDVEHALDKKFAEISGVDTANLLVSQPNCGEDALNIADTLIRTNAIDVLVVDSVAALVPKAELDGNIGDTTVGAQARLMSQAMRRLTGIIARSKCLCVFTNQIREKIGVLYGSPETTPGGRALKFFASVRIDVRKKDMLKTTDGTPIGFVTKLKTIKNKVAPPFAEVELPLLFSEGFSSTLALLDLALEYKILDKKGAWWSMDGTLIGQGKDAASATIKENPDLRRRIECLVREKMISESSTILAQPARDLSPTPPVETLLPSLDPENGAAAAPTGTDA